MPKGSNGNAGAKIQIAFARFVVEVGAFTAHCVKAGECNSGEVAGVSMDWLSVYNFCADSFIGEDFKGST